MFLRADSVLKNSCSVPFLTVCWKSFARCEPLRYWSFDRCEPLRCFGRWLSRGVFVSFGSFVAFSGLSRGFGLKPNHLGRSGCCFGRSCCGCECFLFLKFLKDIVKSINFKMFGEQLMCDHQVFIERGFLLKSCEKSTI